MVELTLENDGKRKPLRWKKNGHSALLLRCAALSLCHRHDFLDGLNLLDVDLPGHDHDRGLWSLSVAYVYPGCLSWTCWNRAFEIKELHEFVQGLEVARRCRRKSFLSLNFDLVSFQVTVNRLCQKSLDQPLTRLDSSGTAQPRITYLWASQGRRRQQDFV